LNSVALSDLWRAVAQVPGVRDFANGLGSYALSNVPNKVFGTVYSGADVGLGAGTWRCMNSTQTQGGFWVGLYHRIA
jgi:hypothetical protein